MITVQSVRIYPTATQEITLNSWMKLARRVWNHFLEHRRKIYARRGEASSAFSQQKMLTKWRRNDPEMMQVPLCFLRDPIHRLQKSFDAFFRRIRQGEKKVGFPRFKGRGQWSSLCCTAIGKYTKNGRILVPKLGTVRCRNLRDIEGVIKCLNIVRKADRWFAQLTIDDGRAIPEKVTVIDAVGIDVGLTSFIATSDGIKVPAPRELQKREKQRRRIAKRLSRRTIGSKRRLFAKKRLAKLHMKIADRRADFTHKLSKVIVQTYDLIAIEDLDIKGMIGGKFSKSIHDAAWRQFALNLSYKAASAGKTFVRVDPKGTTQQCHKCGKIVPKKLWDRVHDCPHCGLVMDRDENAANNILQRAQIGAVCAESKRVEIPLMGRRQPAGTGR